MKIKSSTIKICLLFVFSLGLLSFLPNDRNYQTECVSLESDGYLTIKIWDTQKRSLYKAVKARKDAVNAVLYSGVAGSNGCPTQPPILKTADEQEKFKSIEEAFFSRNGKWVMFTRSAATETTVPSHVENKSWKVYQVSVSKGELRKYLEENNIIKPLNQGF
ncbi:hypothetical protein CJD36_020220 [Flavipsychrobacter stenotrophus]|uniref:Uncharacterized protein n=1 Tax=Flavipsychrobacter stenotrophus TaxID=2077091 RepID=A0A2S7SR86_9BACT|nr:hypothetical protein [Flavipsychrobacter stenotrophus]PQJ09125.1 hypothetical protein CJD36_020220 [Flavipsychrobacter stenotrophus]